MNDVFLIYRSFVEAIRELEPEDQLKAYNAIMDYALDGTEPEIKGPAMAVFRMARPQIDANNKRREAGKAGAAKTNSKAAEERQTSGKPSASERQEVGKASATERQESGTAGALPDKVKVNKESKSIKERVSKDTPKKDETPEAFVGGLEEPAEVKKELLEYIAMRKKIKKPLTAHAMQINYNNLLKISGNEANKVAIIKQSIGKCWLDFYPLTLPRQTARSGTNFSNERPVDPNIEAVLLGEA